jgi:hypothetical protein
MSELGNENVASRETRVSRNFAGVHQLRKMSTNCPQLHLQFNSQAAKTNINWSKSDRIYPQRQGLRLSVYMVQSNHVPTTSGRPRIGPDVLNSAERKHGGRVREAQGRVGQINPSNIPDYLVALQIHWPVEMSRSEPFQRIASRQPFFN